jgi:hypothetical protein
MCVIGKEKPRWPLIGRVPISHPCKLGFSVGLAETERVNRGSSRKPSPIQRAEAE